ncbi:MAG TPA: aldehyde dehydrogenase family protein, partial [Candidatus Acidoferrales bacterium]|nr:aldehyde dehydrogenase family protein [Candidatus Acidoferrales bacterium]
MREELFVGGAWVPSTGTEWIPVENPATEKLITRVPDATAEDVDGAVGAARDAFGPWSATDPSERARLLTTLRDALKARQNEMAQLITEEMGAPTKLARGPQT